MFELPEDPNHQIYWPKREGNPFEVTATLTEEDLVLRGTLPKEVFKFSVTVRMANRLLLAMPVDRQVALQDLLQQALLPGWNWRREDWQSTTTPNEKGERIVMDSHHTFRHVNDSYQHEIGAFMGPGGILGYVRSFDRAGHEIVDVRGVDNKIVTAAHLALILNGSEPSSYMQYLWARKNFCYRGGKIVTFMDSLHNRY